MKFSGTNFIYLVAISIAFSLFISCSSQKTTIKTPGLAVLEPEPEAISPEEWADEIEIQLIVHREAFEELSLELMKRDMESYKIVKNCIKSCEDEFEFYLDELAGVYTGNFSFRGAES